MHIAFVTPTFPSENGWGGIGTYVWHLARALVARGQRVTVLCGYRETPSVREEDGVRVVRRIRTAGVAALERAQQIAALLEEEIPQQHVDAIEFGEYGGDGALFQRRHPGFPVVVKLHCPTRLCALGESPEWQRWWRRYYLARPSREVDRLERESVGRAHAVLAPSRWMLATLQRWGWPLRAGATVVPNPFGGWPGAMPAPASGAEDETALDVLVLGRLARIKGADLLPRILRGVWRAAPGTRFEFVGQDTLRTRHEGWQSYLLRHTPSSGRANLTFRPGVSYDELPSVLSRHRIGLFVSRFESASYTLMECMWAGLACVVASQGGAQELGEDGRSVLNTPRQPAAIVTNLVRLLRDGELRRRLSSGARARVEAAFCPTQIAAQMESIYERAIAEARVGSASPLLSGGAAARKSLTMEPSLEDARSGGRAARDEVRSAPDPQPIHFEPDLKT